LLVLTTGDGQKRLERAGDAEAVALKWIEIDNRLKPTGTRVRGFPGHPHRDATGFPRSSQWLRRRQNLFGRAQMGMLEAFQPL
jgi:hypothetical protein